MAPYDTASFAAGQNCGTRIASCIARLAAAELMRDAHWWNRWRRGAMSSALIAHAEELENDADREPVATQAARDIVLEVAARPSAVTASAR